MDRREFLKIFGAVVVAAPLIGVGDVLASPEIIGVEVPTKYPLTNEMGILYTRIDGRWVSVVQISELECISSMPVSVPLFSDTATQNIRGIRDDTYRMEGLFLAKDPFISAISMFEKREYAFCLSDAQYLFDAVVVSHMFTSKAGDLMRIELEMKPVNGIEVTYLD